MTDSNVPRTLIYIPIIHSGADMGQLGQFLPVNAAQQRQAQSRWGEIVRRVRALPLHWPSVMVYQDGLPDAQQEIVDRILAEVRSPNYELLRWLAAQGAVILGTESPALLREEYDHLQAVLRAPNPTAAATARRRYAERAAGLLRERDTFVAHRIAATLPAGGTGLLFIGQAHHVADHLPDDIAIHSLTNDPAKPGRLRAQPCAVPRPRRSESDR